MIIVKVSTLWYFASLLSNDGLPLLIYIEQSYVAFTKSGLSHNVNIDMSVLQFVHELLEDVFERLFPDDVFSIKDDGPLLSNGTNCICAHSN